MARRLLTTGTAEDIGKLRLSQEIRDFIADCIIEGLDTKGVRDIFKKRQHALWNFLLKNRGESFTYQGVRDYLVTSDDIYNIWKDMVTGSIMLDKDESQSILLWEARLSVEKNLTCFNDQESTKKDDIGTMIAFTVPAAKDLLLNSPTILLHSTHDTNKQGHYLFTLLAPDPATGKGVPLAHLICSRTNLCSIAFWLYCLKDQLPGWKGPHSFVVDCDKSQIAAIRD